MAQWQLTLLVGLGGFLGTVARYLFGLAVAGQTTMAGAATFGVNLLGSLAMGICAGMAGRQLGEAAWLFLATGVLGGFTTYSAYNGEALLLLREGRLAYALAYMGLTLLLCLGAGAAGFWLAARG